jgi:hypothetical protein
LFFAICGACAQSVAAHYIRFLLLRGFNSGKYRNSDLVPRARGRLFTHFNIALKRESNEFQR